MEKFLKDSADISVKPFSALCKGVFPKGLKVSKLKPIFE